MMELVIVICALSIQGTTECTHLPYPKQFENRQECEEVGPRIIGEVFREITRQMQMAPMIAWTCTEAGEVL